MFLWIIILLCVVGVRYNKQKYDIKNWYFLTEFVVDLLLKYFATRATGWTQMFHHWPMKARACSIFGRHYDDVIMGAIASQITSLTIVYSIVYSGADQSKNQSSALLAFVWGIHRGPVNSPHKWPVTRKMFPFDDVIMKIVRALELNLNE